MLNARRLLKLLHEIGAIGVIGAFACLLVMHTTAPTGSVVAYAAVRASMAMVSKWILVPSLLIVLTSGLLAIVATKPYRDAGWVWVKALLGISMFEGTLLTVSASTRRAAELAELATTGSTDAPELARIIHTELGGLWILLLVSTANIVLAIWRPRFSRRHFD